MLDGKLDTFLMVAQLGSCTAAAQQLGLTQPAVTQHLARLEEHYGCAFFTREGRTMRLTPQGEEFLHYVRMQRSNEQQLVKRLRRRTQPLRIGSTLSIADYYLPPRLGPLLAQPGFALDMQVANTDTLLGRLVEGQLDAALIEGIFDRGAFEAHEICRTRFVPVAAADHPLAGRPVRWEELYPYPLILREKGSGTRAMLENSLAQNNDSLASFAQVWQVGSLALIKHLLRHSQGVSFLYEEVAAQEVAQDLLIQLDLEGYSVTHPLHLVVLKNSLEYERVMDFYRRCTQPQPPEQ